MSRPSMYTGLPLMPAMTPVLRERTAFEPGQDQVAVRADDVLEHADDVRLELLDAGAVEDRPADADHPGTDVGDAHLRGVAGRQGRRAPSRTATRVNDEGVGWTWVRSSYSGRSACWSRRNGRFG